MYPTTSGAKSAHAIALLLGSASFLALISASAFAQAQAPAPAAGQKNHGHRSIEARAIGVPLRPLEEQFQETGGLTITEMLADVHCHGTVSTARGVNRYAKHVEIHGFSPGPARHCWDDGMRWPVQGTATTGRSVDSGLAWARGHPHGQRSAVLGPTLCQRGTSFAPWFQWRDYAAAWACPRAGGLSARGTAQ
jgi:hypothetical protein